MGCRPFDLGHAMLNSVDLKWTHPDGYDESSVDQGYHRDDFFLFPFLFFFFLSLLYYQYYENEEYICIFLSFL